METAELIHEPDRRIETFGSTRFEFLLLSEMMDSIGHVRIRTGEVELFGQPCPVQRQRACRHLIAEARLLALGGAEARDAIRKRKRSGMKTEPAFADYFRLEGDPYDVLEALSDLSSAAFSEKMSHWGH